MEDRGWTARATTPLAETKKVRECEGGQRETDGAALHPRLPLSSSSPRLLRFHSVPSFHSATTPLALGRTHTHTHAHGSSSPCAGTWEHDKLLAQYGR
jgi:hypothetical protein